MKRLAIITTHPIQYYAPLFQLINEKKLSFSIKVFYTLGQAQKKITDPDFGISFEWDIPLLEGYEYTFVENVSANPGTRSFMGIINPTLIEEIEQWKADAVLIIGWSFKSHLKALRYFHGRFPVLFRGDSNLLGEPSRFSIKKVLRRVFLYWVYRHIDFALYVGEANKEYFLVHGVKEKKLLFSPHAVDNNRYSGNKKEYEEQAGDWRKKLGIKEQECVFLFSAKLTEKKDPEILIKAFIELNQIDTCLIIVGSGELEMELKERYRNEPKIFFIPFQNQSMMPVVYRLGDIFVLPSKGPGETWGLAVNEAMACGRGVIVSDKCGCSKDLIDIGKNGYIFKSGDRQSLQNCMKLSLGSYKEFGQHSYRIIQNWNYFATLNTLDMWSKKQAANEGS